MARPCLDHILDESLVRELHESLKAIAGFGHRGVCLFDIKMEFFGLAYMKTIYKLRAEKHWFEQVTRTTLRV